MTATRYLYSMHTELGSKEFWDRLSTEPGRLAAEVCLIDTTKLYATLQGHASLHAWVIAAHESAKIEEERKKWEVTKARAKAYIGSVGTVGDRQAAVEMTWEVQQAQEALFAVQEKRGALRAMADALVDRKDMLIQISAKQRQERGNY